MMAPAALEHPGAWPILLRRTDMPESNCSVPDCPKPVSAKGLCGMHYAREHRRDPEVRRRIAERKREWRRTSPRGQAEREETKRRRRERYQTDEEYRRRVLDGQAKKYREDVTYREKARANARRNSAAARSNPDYQSKRNAQNKSWLQANPQKRAHYREAQARTEREKAAFVAAFKRAAGCIDCGTYVGKMDFDHRHPGEKSFGLAKASSRSWSDIRDEIAKCDVRCARCHQLRHIRLDPEKVVRAGRLSRSGTGRASKPMFGSAS